MKARTFNSLMPKYNEIWASNALNMKWNNFDGPDAIDEEKAVEFKFSLSSPTKSKSNCWRVLGHQLDYQNDYPEIYWGLGFYNLVKGVEDFRREDFNDLEKFVKNRELYIVKWDWMSQFNLYHQKGETELSSWDHYLLYPKFESLPKTTSKKEVEGGVIYFTQDISEDIFSEKKYFENFDDKCPF